MSERIAFVTGAGGCVGRQLIGELLDAGWDITALLMAAEADSFAFRDDPSVHSVVGDLNTVAAESIPQGAVVFHLAAHVHTVPKTDEQKQMFFTVNTDGTAHLAAAAKERSSKGFVFVSTIAVYGDAVERPDCDETTPLTATTPYGQSKAAAEAKLAEVLGDDVPYVICRPAVIYGPGDRGNFLRLISAVLGGSFPVVDGGSALKNTLYVRNLARTLALFGAETARFTGEAFNVADPLVHSMRQIAETVAEAAGTEVRIRNLPSLLLMPFALLGDLAGKLLGREMPISRRRIHVMTSNSVIETRKLHEAIGDEVEFLSLPEGLSEYLAGPDAPVL